MRNFPAYIIRVYGIIINKHREVLISDEYFADMEITKFPGGGMEIGEGPLDCLKREALEEFGQEIEIKRHFYTTDFFQQALFYPNHQLVSIYYEVKFKGPINFKISKKAFDFPNGFVNGSQSFRWAPISKLCEEFFTFPIDRVVGAMLRDIETEAPGPKF